MSGDAGTVNSTKVVIFRIARDRLDIGMKQTNMQGIVEELRLTPQNLDINSWKLRAVDTISEHFQVDKVSHVYR